jgi:hypothetical protein
MGISLLLLAFVLPSAQNPPQRERNKNIVTLEESIKGRENDVAEQVWKNIELFKGQPASRVLRVMEFAFTPALGVGCDHCHEPGKWESDEKKPKQTARKMWAMQREVSQQIKMITGKENAAINCTTCHRGDTTPALNLNPSGSMRRGN